MAFKVLAADDGIFVGKDSGHTIILGQLTLAQEKKGLFGRKQKRYMLKDDISEVEVIDEEAYRTGLATAGWGLVGIAVAGPFGAVIGGWFGGKKDNVVAAVKMTDGTKFLGQFTRKQYRKLTKDLRMGAALEKFSSHK